MYHTPLRIVAIGLVIAIGLPLFSIVIGGSAASFFDLQSLLLVFGGTLGATLIQHSPREIMLACLQLIRALESETVAIRERLAHLLEIARQSRRHGVLSIEGEIAHESIDPFMRKGLSLVIDGYCADDVRRIMAIESTLLDDRYRRASDIFQTMGTVAPAMGLVGTLVGLVQMLNHLSDPTALGPHMAVALLTTFYGAISAYLIFYPLSGKLRNLSDEEALLKQMTVEGIISIADGANPLMIEQKLSSYAIREAAQNYE